MGNKNLRQVLPGLASGDTLTGLATTPSPALTDAVAEAPAGGTGTAAGGYDTAANRDLMIAQVNNLRARVIEIEAALVAQGLILP